MSEPRRMQSPISRAEPEAMAMLRSKDPQTRLSAIQNIALYLNNTLHPSGIDLRFFPTLRVVTEQKEQTVDPNASNHVVNGINTDYFPVLRIQRRLQMVASYVPALIERLADTNLSVRAAAAYMLGDIGDPRARAPLEVLLNDPDPNVRNAVQTALDKTNRTGQ